MNIALNVATAQTVDIQIEQQLRKLIETGELKEGARLPTIGELAAQWHVGRNSISKALARLAADNIVECKSKRGIFIKKLNVRSVIGVLIGPDLTDESSYFHRLVLKNLRIKAGSDGKWNLRIYDGLTKLREQPDLQSLDSYEQFADDLRNYPFKGILKLSGGLDKRELSLLNPDIPLVRLGINEKNSEIVLDYVDFMRSSLEFASSRDTKNIAYFRTFNSKDISVDIETLNEWTSESSRNVSVKTYQLYDKSVTPETYEAFYYARTLEVINEWSSSEDKTKWPDAILISDDVAAMGILKALTEKGFNPQNPHHVIILANEGIEHNYNIPVTRYEFSPVRIAETLLDLLKKRICNEALPHYPVKIKGHIC